MCIVHKFKMIELGVEFQSWLYRIKNLIKVFLSAKTIRKSLVSPMCDISCLSYSQKLSEVNLQAQ